MSVRRKGRIIILIILAVSMSGIYGFTDLKGTYYNVMRSSLRLTDVQLGQVFGAFGVTAAASYLFGGWLADRFAPLKIIAFALLASGILHWGFSLRPGFPVQIILSGGMGIAAVLAFFPASTKLITALSVSDSAGGMFGLYYGLGGIVAFVVSLAAAHVYSGIPDKTAAFVLLMRCYAVLNFIAMLAVIVLIGKAAVSPALSGENKISTALLKPVLKNPKVWRMAGVVFCAYYAFRVMTYVTPYLTDVYGMRDETAVYLSVLRTGLLLPSMSFLFGHRAEREGSTAKVIRRGLLIFGIISLLLILNNLLLHSMEAVLLLTTVFIAMGAGTKNIAMGMIREEEIPINVTGTVVGVVSVIGFSPDIFLYPAVGAVIGSMGPDGYLLLFAVSALIGLAGTVLARRL